MPEEFYPDRFAIAIFLVDLACFADGGVTPGGAFVIQFAVSSFDLPAGQELVFCSRAFTFDHVRTMALLPARYLLSPVIPGLFL